MNKQSLIAFVLIGAILLLWPVYNEKFLGIKSARRATVMQDSTAGPVPAEQPAVRKSEPIFVTDKTGEESRTTITSKTPAEIIMVETSLFEGEISSLGGGTIQSWMLKKYGTVDDKLVNLVPEGSIGNLGFSLDIPEGPVVDFDDVVFNVQNNEISTENGIETQRIVFVYENPEIGRVTKTMIIRDGHYDIEVDYLYESIRAIGRNETLLLRWNSGLPSTEENVKEESSYHQAFALQGGEVMKKKKGTSGLCEGSTDWVAVRNKYFMVAMFPVAGRGEAALLSAKEDATKAYDSKGKAHDWKSYIIRMDVKRDDSDQIKTLVYLGPMDYQTLKGYEVGLEKTMDFGWALFKVFSIPFLYVLHWLGDKVGNYGWAIIIFSILIKVALFPLTRKSFHSMKAMQTLQPKVKAIQDKFKDNPKKMNKEVMALYKEQGVNPMGGCLPMILQMPILISLFRLFRSTIVFRHATFYGIQDLAGPDALISFGSTHINVLPIIMGASMIIQQKLSSASSDPRQKMMAFTMPIFFLFIFYNFASGLNLYYLMFNLFTIAQELIMKKKKQADEASS